jgi:hypothetical protein
MVVVFRIGLFAIALSFVPWLAIAAAPLLGLSLGESAGLVAGAAVVAEMLFWTGLAMAGRDTWHAIRTRGWRRAPRELFRLLVRGRPAPPRPAVESDPPQPAP